MLIGVWRAFNGLALYLCTDGAAANGYILAIECLQLATKVGRRRKNVRVCVCVCHGWCVTERTPSDTVRRVLSPRMVFVTCILGLVVLP